MKKPIFPIDDFLYYLEPPFVCVRLSDLYNAPLFALSTGCGSCMEYSLVYREIAHAAGLTVRSIHARGEDHNWDEVLINGTWVIVDSINRKFDVEPEKIRPCRGSICANFSYVFGVYPNGTTVNLTHRYANISTLVITVTDREGRPIKGAKVLLFSNNLRMAFPDRYSFSLYTSLYGITDDKGRVALNIYYSSTSRSGRIPSQILSGVP